MHSMCNIKFTNAQHTKDWQCIYNTVAHSHDVYTLSATPAASYHSTQKQWFYGDLISTAKLKCTSVFI
jgi:hypothetical protein